MSTSNEDAEDTRDEPVVKRKTDTETERACELELTGAKASESAAVAGCKGCVQLSKKAEHVKQAWRQHCTKEVTINIDREKKASSEREKQMRSDFEEEKKKWQNYKERVEAELDQLRRKLQQEVHESANKDIHLARGKAIIERSGLFRIEAIEFIEQIERDYNNEHSNNNISEDNTSQSPSSKRKEHSEVAVQTDLQHIEVEHEEETARAVQLNASDSTKNGPKLKTVSDIAKAAKRLGRKRIELTETIDSLNKEYISLKARPSSGADEEEGGECNGGSLTKRARTVSSPIEDPSHPAPLLVANKSLHEALIEDDDDDIQVLEVITPVRAPYTPPLPSKLVEMNGTTSDKPPLSQSAELTRNGDTQSTKCIGVFESSDEELTPKSKKEELIKDYATGENMAVFRQLLKSKLNRQRDGDGTN